MKRGPRPEYARIRISTLESYIGRCEAKQDRGGEAALRFFARQCMIDLNETNIHEYADIYKAELERWQKEDQERVERRSKPQ